MTRLTEDLKLVEESEEVWEIMYSYVNPEFSRAVPELRVARQIPKWVKIWKHQSHCRAECIKRNKSEPYQLYEQKFYTISFQEKHSVWQ